MTVEHDELALGSAALGLNLNARAHALLLDYLELLSKWNRVYNLTAVRESERMVTTHLLDSLAASVHLTPGRAADIGSGAGLPGIPLAITWPEQTITLIESNHKKAAFLRQAAIELALTNVEVVCERVEKWHPPQCYDIVISRAFADLPEFIALSARLCAPGGTLVGMKGVYPYEEIAQLPVTVKLRSVVPLKVPGLTAERHLVLLDPVH